MPKLKRQLRKLILKINRCLLIFTPLFRILTFLSKKLDTFLLNNFPPLYRLKKRFFRKRSKRVNVALSLIAVIALSVMLFNAHRTDAAWYDNDWAYRQLITVTNSAGSTQTNYQYLLTVNTATLINGGKLQIDCDDIRFTNNGGNELKYFLASGCNTTTTQVWVLIDSLPTSTSQIFMYYGNPSTSSKSNSGAFAALTNLAGYWPFNEGSSSTAQDASGNSKVQGIAIGSSGTQTTTIQAWTNGATGKIGGSINLDGTDDNTALTSGTLSYTSGKFGQGIGITGSNTLNGASAYLTFDRGTQVSGNRYSTVDGNQGSVSFWYRPSYAYDTSLDRVLFEFPSLMKLIYNNSTDKFDFGYWNGSDFTTVKVSSSAQTFTANSWVYVAVTWDADNSPYLQIKTNNETIQQYNSSFTVQTPAATNYIGADASGQNGAAGTLDDFIITALPLRNTEAGTVSSSGTTVTGSSTSFLNLSQSGYQDSLTFSGDSTVYTVNTISSATALTLTQTPSVNKSAGTAFKAGQMVALYNEGVGNAATIIESHQRLFYATMDDNGYLLPSNPSGATSMPWVAASNLAPNGTMEAASSGTPTSWSASSTPTLDDASTANILSDTRTQSIAVTAISRGITLTSNLTVSAGERYRVGAWVKSDGTNRANLRIRNVTASSDLATLTTTSSTWQLLQTDITIPASMTSLNIFLESGTAATYTFYVDDVGIWLLP